MNAQKMGRLALMTATTGFLVGVALLNSGTSNAIGGLCNGAPASHTWLDASGQYGPALIDGTDDDDNIVGSDGDDTIDAGDGFDYVCGMAGDDSIAGGAGGDVIRGGTGDDDLDGGDGEDTVHGEGGNDTVAGGGDADIIHGGDGDDVIIAGDDGGVSDDVYAGKDFDVCLIEGGEDIHSECEY
jgi:Ca2+-binding RTX toxin-like protein